MSLRSFLDKIEHHFEKGGKYEKVIITGKQIYYK